jgi:hypothetical protein
MKLRAAVLLLGVLVGLPSMASAQVAGLRPSPSVLFTTAPLSPVDSDSLNLPRTHWKEGAILLGGFGTVAGVLIGVGFCGYDGASTANCPRDTALTALLLGLSGATIGALIGGQFPKSE